MKKVLIIIVTVIVAMSCTAPVILYKNYIKASEELLWMIEEICEQNDLPWGDTVCETDVWVDYCEARKNLGLDYFKHYSER